MITYLKQIKDKDMCGASGLVAALLSTRGGRVCRGGVDESLNTDEAEP